VQQEIGILDAFGDAFVGQQFADVVTVEEFRKLVGGRPSVYTAMGFTPRRAAASAAAGKNRSLPRPRPSPHAVGSAPGERAHDLFHDHFRRRGAGGDAEALDARELAPVEIGGALRSTAIRQPSRSATSRRRCELTSSARRPRSRHRPPAPPSLPRAGGWWWP